MANYIVIMILLLSRANFAFLSMPLSCGSSFVNLLGKQIAWFSPLLYLNLNKRKVMVKKRKRHQFSLITTCYSKLISPVNKGHA